MKVMIAGAGGNNSWLIKHLQELRDAGQISEEIKFVIFDGDTIEIKNLKYQNFDRTDVLDNKAEVLAKRYDMGYVPSFITKESDFNTFDVVISGVDNKSFREMLFRYMEKHPEKYWIDLRAEGRTVAIFTKSKRTLQQLLSTLPNESRSASCQYEYDLSSGIIQLGNRIAAIIGAQYLLNYLRGLDNPPEFIQMF